MSHPAKVIDLYDSLLDAKDDRTRAKIIASAFESLEDRYPELRDMATAGGVRETELRLQKEIEQVRANLSKDIEQVRADLSKEIEQVRADLSRQIAAGNVKMLFWTAGLLFAQMVTIVAVILGVTMG
jgi:Zn-dependent M32 family carboxypeptidase